jgi:hypothetical protein
MENSPITFLSFCVDIGRDKIDKNNSVFRDFELYKVGMCENIETNVPLILHTSVENVNIPNHRNENNFRLHHFDTSDIEKEFPNFQLYREMYENTKKDDIERVLFYYNPLVVLKMKKMMDAIKENPFNSDYFLWIDCHFTRGIMDCSFMEEENSYLKMYENIKIKNKDKFLLFTEIYRPYGFFWGGNKTAIENVYEKYFEFYFESLPNKLLTEELLFKKIHEYKPDLFNYIDISNYGGSYKMAVYDYLMK